MTATIRDAPASVRRQTSRALHLAEPPESLEPGIRSSPRRLRRLLIASDILAITFGYAVATMLQQVFKPVPDDVLREEMLFSVMVVPIWVLMMGANNLFLARAVSQFGEELRRLVVAGLMASGFLVAVLFIAQYDVLFVATDHEAAI